MQLEAVKALVWIYARRDQPDLTFEDAGGLKLADLPQRNIDESIDDLTMDEISAACEMTGWSFDQLFDAFRSDDTPPAEPSANGEAGKAPSVKKNSTASGKTTASAKTGPTG